MEKLLSIKNILLPILCIFMVNSASAQCATWLGSPDEGKATDAHTIYRGHMKAKDLDAAYEHWKIAYDIAPAADGKRDFHYSDGVKIMMHKYNSAEGAAKEEAKQAILRLYDEAIACFEKGGITMKQSAEERVAYHLTRKAFDMFYYLHTPYSETIEAVEGAIAKSGNNAEYTLLDPYARIAVNMFTNDNMDKAKARAIHAKINEIADYNIANNADYGAYYKQAKDAANGVFAEIEDNIFDCDYFKPKIKATYDANPDDPTTIETAIRDMKRKACSETDPFLVELETKWEKYAAAENARRKAEFEANNPAAMAKKAKEAGDYSQAIAKYEEAIAAESDPTKQGLYYYQIAQIKGKKMKSFSGGMAAARKAIELRPDWGAPHLLIGDLYIQNSKACGDAFKQKCCYLAAVDKYRQARSVDPSMADKASEKIGRYAGTKPEKENAFMQGYKEGQTVKLSCIGTSVKLRF